VLCVGKPTAWRSNPPPKQSKSEPKEAIRNYWAQTLLGSGEDGWQAAVRTVAGLALHTVRAGFSASARDIETDFSSLADLPAVPNTIPSRVATSTLCASIASQSQLPLRCDALSTCRSRVALTLCGHCLLRAKQPFTSPFRPSHCALHRPTTRNIIVKL
jgi:hypothetical protein